MEELEGENYYTVISRIVTRYLMGERDLEQIESALKNYPEDPFLWELKGTIHFELENFDKASQALRTAVGYGSQEGKVFVYLGVSLLELHDFDEGLSYFDQALLLEPDDRDVYQFYQRAVTYANLIEQLR
jgi:tetratricopeptide (TPR) repeat protein